MVDSTGNKAQTTRLIADPVHGMIAVDDFISFLIDQPEFQRLRNLQQLGLASFVYPSATHNRFQHSLGTYHLAKLWIETLKEKRGDLNITEEDVRCVCVAALYHDLGHGPFSHLWDNIYVKRRLPNNVKPHEEIGIIIFRNMMKRHSFAKKWLDFGMKMKHVDVIEAIIQGKLKDHKDEEVQNVREVQEGQEDHEVQDVQKMPAGKEFLLLIVANHKTEIDVDKWDYLMRDSYYACNSMIEISFRRFQEWLTFKRGANGEWTTAIRDKDYINAVKIFTERLRMHRQVYQHKTVTAINEMLYDALVCVEDVFDLKRVYTKDNIDSFLTLTDDLLWKIFYGCIPHQDKDLSEEQKKKMEKGKAIVHRILSRDLYKHISTFTILSKDLKHFQQRPENKDRGSIVDELKEKIKARGFEDHEFCVTMAKFALAGDMSNPLKEMYVFNKLGKEVPQQNLSRGIHLNIEPEVEIRLYCKISNAPDETLSMMETAFKEGLHESIDYRYQSFIATPSKPRRTVM